MGLPFVILSCFNIRILVLIIISAISLINLAVTAISRSNNDISNVLLVARHLYFIRAQRDFHKHFVFAVLDRRSADRLTKCKNEIPLIFYGISHFFNGAPRGIRTPDLLIRSERLYPAELWAHTS